MTTGDDLLTHAEIAALTGRQKYRAQVRALIKMGVRHAVRPDGSPVVLRAHRDALLVRSPDTAPPRAKPAPGVVNLDGLVPRQKGKKTM